MFRDAHGTVDLQVRHDVTVRRIRRRRSLLRRCLDYLFAPAERARFAHRARRRRECARSEIRS